MNRVNGLSKIGKAYSTLEQEYEREPSTTEIAQQLDMTDNEVEDTLRISGRHFSMDSPFRDQQDNSLLDVIPNDHQPLPDYELMNGSLKVEIDRALATLTKREAQILRLYYGLGYEHPMTLEEIGERFNLTRERIRQIKEKALQRLRHASRSKALRKFLC
jgi:RNA polymerase primary sigma factor